MANELKQRNSSNFPHPNGRIAIESDGESMDSLSWPTKQAISSLVMDSAGNACNTIIA